jgi:hypothetical protein
MKPNLVTREWRRKVTLAKKAGAGELERLKVGTKGLIQWSATKEWPIRCVGTTIVQGVKLFIFVGKSWRKKQVESTVRLTLAEALDAMKRARPNIENS